MSRFRLPGLATVAIAALALAGCATPSTSTSPEGESGGTTDEQVTLNVGITPIVNAASVYVGIDNGQFTDHNLEVTPTVVQNTSTAIPSLMNGELDIALINSVALVTAGAKELPIQVISGSDRYPTDASVDTTALVVNSASGISEVTDLEGKTVAVVGLKSGPELATRVVLEESGVSPDAVDFVELAYPDMVAAVQAGRVDAAFIVDPFLSKAKAEGLTSISQPFTDGLGGMSAMTWVTSEEFAATNPEIIENFNTAVREASEYANDNPDAVRAILPEFTSLSEEAIENTVLSHYDSSLTADDLESWSDLLAAHGFIAEGYEASGLLWTQP